MPPSRCRKWWIRLVIDLGLEAEAVGVGGIVVGGTFGVGAVDGVRVGHREFNWFPGGVFEAEIEFVYAFERRVGTELSSAFIVVPAGEGEEAAELGFDLVIKLDVTAVQEVAFQAGVVISEAGAASDIPFGLDTEGLGIPGGGESDALVGYPAVVLAGCYAINWGCSDDEVTGVGLGADFDELAIGKFEGVGEPREEVGFSV